MARKETIMDFLIKHDDSILQPIGRFAEEVVTTVTSTIGSVKAAPFGSWGSGIGAIIGKQVGSTINTVIHLSTETVADFVAEKPPISDVAPIIIQGPPMVIDVSSTESEINSNPLIMDTNDNQTIIEPKQLGIELNNVESYTNYANEAITVPLEAQAAQTTNIGKLSEALISSPINSTNDMANWKDPRITELNLSEEMKLSFKEALQENLAVSGDLTNLMRLWEEKIEQQENNTANVDETLQRDFNDFVTGSNQQSDIEQICSLLEQDLIETNGNSEVTDIHENNPSIEQIETLHDQGSIGNIDNLENADIQETDALIEQFRSLEEQGIIGNPNNTVNSEHQVNDESEIYGMINPEFQMDYEDDLDLYDEFEFDSSNELDPVEEFLQRSGNDLVPLDDSANFNHHNPEQHDNSNDDEIHSQHNQEHHGNVPDTSSHHH